MATISNIAFKRGEDITITDTIAGSGSITGWTFVFSVRRRKSEPDDAAPLIQKSSGDGITISDAANRVIQVTLTDTDTLLLAAGHESLEYWYDIKRTNDGSEAVLTEGTLMVSNTASK